MTTSEFHSSEKNYDSNEVFTKLNYQKKKFFT